jgi:hypothetical protein
VANTTRSSPRASDWRHDLAPLLVGLVAGLQITLALLTRVGPYGSLPPSVHLTAWSGDVKPERDLSMFVIGGVLTVVLAVGNALLWRRSTRAQPADAAHSTYLAVFQALTALAGLLLGIVLFYSRYPLAPGASMTVAAHMRDVVMLAVLPLATLLLPWLEARRMRRSDVEDTPRARFAALDILTPLFIWLVLFIPPGDWSPVAGRLMANERLHHWNFFAMDPAYAFTQGLSLGTERYTQYGVGWPLLFAGLNHATPLSYSTMLGVSMLWACFYYCGIFLLLRLVTGSRKLAAGSALVALLLQMFNGIQPGAIVWNYPSSTCLRHPFDVWFVLAAWLALRRGSRIWAAVAGALAGLALLFITDTGIYLVGAALLVAVLARLIARRAPQSMDRAALRRSVIFGIPAALVVFIAGLSLASRGAPLSGAFWSGYLEALRTYPALGLGMLPFAKVEGEGVLLFAVFCALYLGVLAWTAVQLLRGTLAPRDLLLAGISLYGLGLLLVFVGRSHPYNLYHAAVPVVVVVTLLLARLASTLPLLARHSIVPAAALVVLALWLVTSPALGDYPTVLGGARARPAGGVYLFPATRDTLLPPDAGFNATIVQQAAKRAAELAREGKVAVLHDRYDLPISLAAGIPVWGRYPALATMLVTQEQVDREVARLEQDAPLHVLLQSPAPDRWQPFRQSLLRTYTKVGETPNFEVWRHK